MDLPKNFYKEVERPGTLKHILYGDTDSVFIAIPDKNAKTMPLDEKWKLTEKTAGAINDLIINYVSKILLPRQNINPDYNKTYFKSELVMESIMFLDVKKSYAYKLIMKEGNPVDPPKIKYTGIQVVRSNTPGLTKDLLKEIIEEVMLNSEIHDKQKSAYVTQVIKKYRETFSNLIADYEFTDIAVPCKWSKRSNIIAGMQLYNSLIGKEVFTPGSAGKMLYCIFKDTKIFKDLNVKDLKFICIPYSYNKEELKDIMIKNNIGVDMNQQWENIYTTVTDRVNHLAKKVSARK